MTSFKLDLIKLLIPSRKITNIKLKEEDAICVQFANYLREITLEKNFPFIWFHVPNQFAISRPIFGLKQSWMGRIAGIPDYVFLGHRSFVMEFKSKTGRLSAVQQIVQVWCEKANVPFYVARNFEEGKEFVNSEWQKLNLNLQK
jgi:hypothetical protein